MAVSSGAREDLGSLKGGDAGGCEPPDMGSGIWIQILLKSGELS